MLHKSRRPINRLNNRVPQHIRIRPNSDPGAIMTSILNLDRRLTTDVIRRRVTHLRAFRRHISLVKFTRIDNNHTSRVQISLNNLHGQFKPTPRSHSTNARVNRRPNNNLPSPKTTANSRDIPTNRTTQHRSKRNHEEYQSNRAARSARAIKTKGLILQVRTN